MAENSPLIYFCLRTEYFCTLGTGVAEAIVVVEDKWSICLIRDGGIKKLMNAIVKMIKVRRCSVEPYLKALS